MLTVQLPQLTVDWQLVTAAVAAAATFAAVLVALLGWRLNDWLRKPRLAISFEKGPPWCRWTTLASKRRAYWVRLQVRNNGVNPARACVGKVTRVNAATGLSDDIDPLQLRWCGVPDRIGFDPIHLAKNQDEFLNVFRIAERDAFMGFETFPPEDFAPGHPTYLPSGAEHQVEISVFADNADPAQAILTVKYSGDFDALPNSLTVSATASSARRPCGERIAAWMQRLRERRSE